MQIIFQDPVYRRSNPRMTVMEIIAEPLLIHGAANKDEIKSRVRELLNKSGCRVQAHEPAIR